MKTTEFIVEYAGIGEDADAMSSDHEVQLARQQCYNAARDAIALHHILKDTPEQENLEDWVVEKLTQAASNLKDVIEHLEEQRNGGGEEIGDIMHAFSVESAEAQYAEMLGEGQINELNPDRYAEYEYAQQDSPRGVATMPTTRMFVIVDRASGRKYPQKFKVRSEAERAAARLGGFSKVKVTSESDDNGAEPVNELKPEFAGDSGEGIEMPARKPVAATPGVKVTKVGADTYRVSYKGKSIECSRREVPHYKQEIMGEGQVNELDSSTMKSYMQKRKESPMPKTLHKAVNQANGVRSASEKIHDQLVKKHAIAGGDTRVREGTAEGGVDSFGNPFPKRSEHDKWEANRVARSVEQFKNKGHDDQFSYHRKQADRLAANKEVEEGKFTVNAKTGAKLDPRTGAELPAKEKPVTMKQMFAQPKAPAQPKLTLNDVWRQVEHVIGQIFPDGDPIDWMGPWLQKRGYKDFQVGDIIDRAARKNGYKDMYAYYNELKQQHADDQAYEKDNFNPYGESVGESEQVDELSQGTLQSYVPKANRSREKATDDMQQKGWDAKTDDKMGRRAEFTMKAQNKIRSPEKVTELSKNTLQSYRTKSTKSEHEAEQNNNGDQADKRLAGRNGATARLNGLSKAPADYKKPVKEDATGGGTSVGGIATSVAGAGQGKPGTGKPKELGNKVSRKQVQVGKGVY